MYVILAFEAVSVARRSHQVEVALALQKRRSGTHLIARAAGWEDWAPPKPSPGSAVPCWLPKASHSIKRQTGWWTL